MATTLDLEFEKCLKLGKIRTFSRGKILAVKELKTAQSDLKSAKSTFGQGNYKWATIQCYYSMFHSGRALLYAVNFREKSHLLLNKAKEFLQQTKNLLK